MPVLRSEKDSTSPRLRRIKSVTTDQDSKQSHPILERSLSQSEEKKVSVEEGSTTNGDINTVSEIVRQHSTNRKASRPLSPQKKRSVPDKTIHKAQDSLFSTSSGYTNYRGFLNLAILLLVLSNARVALENIIKYGILANPLIVLDYLQADPLRYLPFATVSASCILNIAFALLVEIRLASGNLSPKYGWVYHCVNLGLVLLMPMLGVLYFQFDPFSSCFMLGTFTCIFLKLVSYAQVNSWCRQSLTVSPSRRKFESGEGAGPGFGKRQFVRYPQNLNIRDIAYFMAAPTLCYELNFPRSPKIRWWFVAKRFGEFVFLSQVILRFLFQFYSSNGSFLY